MMSSSQVEGIAKQERLSRLFQRFFFCFKSQVGFPYDGKVRRLVTDFFWYEVSSFFFRLCQMGVSKNRGTPKWMVYNGKPY